MVDGNLWISLPVFLDIMESHGGDGVEVGSAIVGLKNRLAELQRYLENSIWLEERGQKDNWSGMVMSEL